MDTGAKEKGMLSNINAFFGQSGKQPLDLNDEEVVATTNPIAPLPAFSEELLADDYQSDDEVRPKDNKAFNRDESLQKMIANQSKVSVIRASLLEIITAIGDNPSVLSKWSRSWGKMPLVAKIGTGAAVALSPGLAGFFVTTSVLLGVGTGLGAAYASAALLLEDHYQCTENTTEKLEKGLNGIVDLLATVIGELDALRNDFSIELDRFVDENSKLELSNQSYAQNNEDLKKVVEQQQGLATKLENEISKLTAIEQELKVERERLLASTEDMQDALRQNKTALVNVQKQSLVTVEEYKQLLHEVSAKQLLAQEQSAATEVKIQKLEETMNELFLVQQKGANPASQEDIESFNLHLKAFMNGGGVDFKKLKTSIDKLEKDNERLYGELEKHSAEYARLNQTNQNNIDKLAAIMASPLANSISEYLVNLSNHTKASTQFFTSNNHSQVDSVTNTHQPLVMNA